MISAPADASAPLVFPVEYRAFAGLPANPDLAGAGTLTLRRDAAAGAPAFVFSGRERRWLFRGPPVELVLAPADIWNVDVRGRALRFDTGLGRAGQLRRPFTFLARTEGEAQEIAARLPAQVDAEFIAGADFAAKLRALPVATRPWTSVTNLIVAANVVVFLVLAGVFGAGWIDVTSMLPYIRYGANNGAATTDGEWWRLLTSQFLHYGIIHLLLNMWALLQVGHLVERLLGRLLYALVYFGSGIAGGCLTLLWHGDKVWSAGASGAIFGVYAALLGCMLREKQSLPRSVFRPILNSTLTFAGYNLLFGFIHPGIDNSAHIGGFVGGLALGWLTALPVDRAARAGFVPRRLLAGGAALAAIVAIGVTFSPRFDYRVADQIAWEETNRGPGSREPDIVKHQDEAFGRYEKDRDGDALARWLTAEAIPFYSGWLQQVSALSLAPGRATAREQAHFQDVLRLRLASLEHLAAGLRAHDAGALARFTEENAALMAKIGSPPGTP